MILLDFRILQSCTDQTLTRGSVYSAVFLIWIMSDKVDEFLKILDVEHTSEVFFPEPLEDENMIDSRDSTEPEIFVDIDTLEGVLITPVKSREL